jgi:hypothetical protein
MGTANHGALVPFDRPQLLDPMGQSEWLELAAIYPEPNIALRVQPLRVLTLVHTGPAPLTSLLLLGAAGSFHQLLWPAAFPVPHQPRQVSLAPQSQPLAIHHAQERQARPNGAGC